MEGNCIYIQSFIENNKNILSVILDLNIDSWILREKYTLSNDNVSVEFTECLEAILAFINSFILQNHHNQLVVSIYGNGKPYCIYKSMFSINNREIIFPKQIGEIAVNLVSHSQQLKILHDHLFKVITEKMSNPSKDPNSTLDTCFSRNLCYILI